MALNMCMFTSRVDYDYAVRKQMEECVHVAEKQQEEGDEALPEDITNLSNKCVDKHQ